MQIDNQSQTNTNTQGRDAAIQIISNAKGFPHKIVICTKQAARLAVLDGPSTSHFGWPDDCLKIARAYLASHGMTEADWHVGNGTVTVWVNEHNQSNFTIRRDYKGVHVVALAREIIGDDAHQTFEHAIKSFSYLLDFSEEITLEAWRWRIAKHAHPSDRVIAVLNAIDRARGALDELAPAGVATRT